MASVELTSLETADAAARSDNTDPEASDTEAVRLQKLKRIFVGLAFVQVVTNFDGGAVPAALLSIKQTFDLDQLEAGLVGSLVYEGIAIGSLLVGPLLGAVSPLRCTQVCLVLNMAATLLFGLSTSKGMLLTFRFLIGFLQAVPAVYFPVCARASSAPSKAAPLSRAPSRSQTLRLFFSTCLLRGRRVRTGREARTEAFLVA